MSSGANTLIYRCRSLTPMSGCSGWGVGVGSTGATVYWLPAASTDNPDVPREYGRQEPDHERGVLE